MSEINQRVVCNGVDFQSVQNTNFKTIAKAAIDPYSKTLFISPLSSDKNKIVLKIMIYGTKVISPDMMLKMIAIYSEIF